MKTSGDNAAGPRLDRETSADRGSPQSKLALDSISAPVDDSRRLHGRALWIARAVWVLVLVLSLSVYVQTLVAQYDRIDMDDENVSSKRVTNVEVNSTAAAAVTYQALEAEFTPSLDKSGPLMGEVVYVGRSCERDMPYHVDVKGRIALMDRGSCLFAEKFAQAQQAGAIGVIVVQNTDDPPGTISGRFPIHIPAVMISRADGDAIKGASQNGTVSVTLSFVKVYPSIVEQLGISRQFYTLYQFLLPLVVLVSFTFLALLIFFRRSDDWYALLLSLTLIIFVTPGYHVYNVVGMHPLWRILGELISDADIPLVLTVLFLLFPDGRFVPRWTWVVAFAIVVYVFKDANLTGLPPYRPSGPAPTVPPFLQMAVSLSFYGISLFAQIYRYRYVSTPIQRQQTKWVLYALGLAVLGASAGDVLRVIFPALDPPGVPSVLFTLAAVPSQTLLYSIVPIAIAFAILRYRLWDIDLVINRTLVYVSLTAVIVGLYTFVVGSLSLVFEVKGNLIVSLLATALVAVLFDPLHVRLQRGANRLMYGERDDPVTVLDRLGKRLETTLAPNAVLPNVVETSATALKLPYAAIALKRGDTLEIAAEHGRPTDEVVRLPLIYQTEPIGELIAAPRARGESFSPADRKLLENVAHQAGAAAHAIRLNADLQRSRERLVTAREEERRRLRRDLHDGLGPRLAALTLKLGSARALFTRDPAAADRMLRQLEKDTEAALVDIRRLVYNLRPPTLDELGLAAAVREAAAAYRSRNEPNARADGLRITVDAPERLPHLGAAVEVAAFRIVQEALTNVVRHAHAHSCLIRVALDGGEHPVMLHLEVSDDGIGLPPGCRAGVGLTSMRERAEELGGTFHADRLPAGGTRVCADVPLPANGVGEIESDG